MCNSKNKSIFVLIMVLCAILLSSCSEKDSNTVKSISFVDDEVTEYVDEHYGFASDPIYATYTSTPSRNGNSISFKNEIKLKEESKSGAIFYKKIKYKGNPNGLVLYRIFGTYGQITAISFVLLIICFICGILCVKAEQD